MIIRLIVTKILTREFAIRFVGVAILAGTKYIWPEVSDWIDLAFKLCALM